MSWLFGKRESEHVKRVVAAPNSAEETRDNYKNFFSDERSYLTVEPPELQPLRYFRVEIQGHRIAALADSGSNRTLLGGEGVEIVRALGIPIRKGNRQIRTANGQIATIRQEATLPLNLEGRTNELSVGLFPELAVPCILGLDFLTAFGIGIDFAASEWYFVDMPCSRYRFVPEEASRVCCGLPELTTRQQAELQVLLQALPRASVGAGLPTTTLTEHRIDVGSHAPIKQRCYVVSPKVQEAIREEVDQMLQDGIIEPSYSEWSNPIVMVKKPNGKYRFCLDFRKVNNISKKDAYPLPNMTSILDKLRAARYISTLDLRQAYHQIPLERGSREITAFSVPGKGLYHFVRMPYGLTGAPATFQRLLDRLIGPEMEPYAFAYLDDIVIVTPTFDEHITWLRKVLDRIAVAGLTINPEKCEFCKPQVRYLGFLVQREGLTVDPDKTRPILEYPTPSNLKQLRRLLGMTSWYRRFIPDFATVAEPWTRLLKKGARWEWGGDQDRALSQVRESLTTAPVLACPDFEQPFVLQTDASSVGLGAVLTQTLQGEERVIAYASRALAGPETRYSVTEQECLAVVWAIRRFRPYLEGYKFTVITDHSSLRWLHNLKNPTGRLARWALELLEYDYAVEYRKGTLHSVPDALSRMFEGESPSAVNVLVDTEEGDSSGDPWYDRRRHEVVTNPKRFAHWRVVDNQLYYLRPKLVVSQIVEDLDRWKLVLPRDSRREALREAHDEPHAGHLGVEKTFQRVAVSYFWPNMFRDVARYVRACDTCQRTKVEQASPAGLMGRRKVEEPWTAIAADIVGPLPRSKGGFQYLLVIQDLFSKWIECRALRSATGPKIREALQDMVLSRWGTPAVLLTDNGTEFVNRVMKQFAEDHGITHTTVPPYHPQANPVERVNRVLKTMIAAFIDLDHREWDEHLSDFRFAYNTAFHTSLGTSPAYLNLGREPRPPNAMRHRNGDTVQILPREPAEWTQRMRDLEAVRVWVAENLDHANQTQAHQYNLRRRPRAFRVGDLVLKRRHVLSSAAQNFAAKLAPKFHGPFRIERVLSPLVYELEAADGFAGGKVHIQDLKPYCPPLVPTQDRRLP